MKTLFFRRLLISAFPIASLLQAAPATAQLSANPLLELFPATYVPGSDSSVAGLALLDLRARRLAPDAVGVVLYWTTSSEPNDAGIVIERRDEGDAAFHRVAVVPGHSGTLPYSYSFVDAYNASATPSTYRLRRLADGTLPSLVSQPQTVPGAKSGPANLDEQPPLLVGMAK
ncbi:hypothetical protein GCM10023185_20490 [Hymenobacter saemangeumensis]|uniref:Uncharacterized protein n=1 Tax=Hymenobacter saemangeumensis TaxID=1084522 RepID=A0ABP8IDL0_9BACT